MVHVRSSASQVADLCSRLSRRTGAPDFTVYCSLPLACYKCQSHCMRAFKRKRSCRSCLIRACVLVLRKNRVSLGPRQESSGSPTDGYSVLRIDFSRCPSATTLSKTRQFETRQGLLACYNTRLARARKVLSCHTRCLEY